MLGRILCIFGLHLAPPGISTKLSVFFECARCRALVPGDWHRKESRR
jgi:hypothetical protein